MLYCGAGMQVVFVIARDGRLRILVRAELRERGIRALGMETADDAGALIGAGTLPSAVVLEASEEVAPGLESLARRVPFVVVASALQPASWPRAARRLRRPVSVGEIVSAVIDVLKGRSA
jgi:hypothetical protein